MVGWHNTEPHRQETVLWERSKDPKGSQGFFHILKKWLSHCRYLDVGIYFFANTILQKWENAQKSQNTLWIITDNFFKCNANQSVTFWFRIFSIFLWYRSISASEIFVIEKSIGIGFEKNWYWSFLFLASFSLFWTPNFDLKSFRFGFETFPCFFMVSVSVS